MKRIILAAAMAAVALPAVPASADPHPWGSAYGWREHQDRDDWRDHDERGDDDDWRDRDHDERRWHRDYRSYEYYHPYRSEAYAEVRLYRRDHIWRGNDGRYYCRRNDGTTGLIVGAAVGGLVGRSLDDGRDRTLGTVLGMVGGGLLGREIDRGDMRCR